MKEKFKRYKATTVLAVLNILIWAVLEIAGNTQDAEFMYRAGAMSAYGVLIDHELWRVFTSNFLHFGPEHLINNMLLLAVAGSYLEPAVGTVGFIIIYIISGVFGSVTSCLYMVYAAAWNVSAGASGAIFGIVGGLLFMIIRGHGSFLGIKLKGMILAVALMLYAGITSKGVDNAAHVGGFVSGFIATAVIFTIRYARRRCEDPFAEISADTGSEEECIED